MYELWPIYHGWAICSSLGEMHGKGIFFSIAVPSLKLPSSVYPNYFLLILVCTWPQGRKARLKATRSSTAQNRYTRGSSASTYSPYSTPTSTSRLPNGSSGVSGHEYSNGSLEDLWYGLGWMQWWRLIHLQLKDWIEKKTQDYPLSLRPFVPIEVLVEVAVLVRHTKQVSLIVWLDNCMKTWVSHTNGL